MPRPKARHGGLVDDGLCFHHAVGEIHDHEKICGEGDGECDDDESWKKYGH